MNPPISPENPSNTFSEWIPPELGSSDLRHRFGLSVLSEFVRGHGPSAVIRELIQNEYDAGGDRLEVKFGESNLQVSGNGNPIDRKGWLRLSVTLGTGQVTDQGAEIAQKVNGIGSKNFGLRSLFLFGDRICVRSNGRQTVLDLKLGTPERPFDDPATLNQSGIRIFVPYRQEAFADLNVFTLSMEQEIFSDFAANISRSLLKLALPQGNKGLRTVAVSSERASRVITWRQHVKQLDSPKRGVTVFARRITMNDSRAEKKNLFEEFEWQKKFELPDEFRQRKIPSYFKEGRSRIKIGLSLPVRRRRLHADTAVGITYYPIGIEHAYTGNGVSISAPFEMDADRSEVIDPATSPFNKWLLDLAVEFTIELLSGDWFERFGADAYRAVEANGRSVIPVYSEAVEARLKEDNCWPTRERGSGKTRISFVPAHALVIASNASLDGFLSDNRYLPSSLADDSVVRSLAIKCGAKEFTLTSLVHLRCAGQQSTHMASKLGTAACYCFKNFPDYWSNIGAQKQCATALDANRKDLSRDNRHDLTEAETTLTAAETLAAPKDLWHVPTEISDGCPIPAEQRLHPELTESPTLKALCQPFQVTNWIREVAERVSNGDATDEERQALYQHLTSPSSRIPNKLVPAIRNAPVLLDKRGEWVSPASVTLPNAAGVRRFRQTLHLPHRDYADDKALSKSLRFRTKVMGDDVVRFAEFVVENPEVAHQFERDLEKTKHLLTPPIVKKLRSIPFLLSSGEQLCAPEDIYLRTPKNLACIGPAGPYPAGSATRLYVKLKCHSKPDAERILQYVATLRQASKSPPQPEILYSELASTLKRSSRTDIKEEKILWTEDGYSSPFDVLLGARWKSVFLESVPIIATRSKILEDACRELGAHRHPRQHHWNQLLDYLGRRYLKNPGPLSAADRWALRQAYHFCGEKPSVADEIPWLLDEFGHLHQWRVLVEGTFVIENHRGLATAVQGMNAPVFFADRHDMATSFFRRHGAKFLSDIQERIGERLGSRRPRPPWLREEREFQYIARLRSPDFASALKEVALRDFTGNQVRDRIHETTKMLRSFREIAFTNEIHVRYRVGKTTAFVSEPAIWVDDTIYLTWLNSRAKLDGALARLLAQKCFPKALDQARFSDSVYRLLTCEKPTDIQDYLEGRGIKWRPLSKDEEDNDTDFLEETIRAAIQITTLPGRAERTTVVKSVQAIEQNGSAEETNGGNAEALVLPSIDQVEAQLRMPSEQWSYSSPSSSGGRNGGGGKGWAPGSRNEEQDRKVGHRGEEIVYRLEKDRVRRLGHAEDRVRWVSQSEPASPFDIMSIDENGNDLFIEVKSTTGSDGKFHWSLGEFRFALQKRKQYILYRVYRVEEHSPVVRIFPDPISLMSRGSLHLEIQSLRAEVEPIG